MALHSDIPSRAEIERLLETDSTHCVSIYLPTHRVTQETTRDRLVLRDLTNQAIQQLNDAGADSDDVADIESHLLHLAEDDDEFWIDQADSLAIFASPNRFETHRLPNHLSASVEVSDQFHITPLLPPGCVGTRHRPGIGPAARGGSVGITARGSDTGSAEGRLGFLGQQDPQGARRRVRPPGGHRAARSAQRIRPSVDPRGFTTHGSHVPLGQHVSTSRSTA